MIGIPEGFDINQLFTDFFTIGALPIAAIGIIILIGFIVRIILKTLETSDYATRDKY